MGLLMNLVLGVVHLFLVAVDILFLLLFAAMLGYRWQPPWLTAINSAGKPAVDWITGHTERVLDHFTKKPPCERMVLFIGMLGLSFLRVFVAALLAR